MKPMDIEKKSMEIIESELTVELDPVEKPIVKRVIHATADFSFAESLHFSAGVVPLMRRMLKSGATVVTDTNMALAGISKPSLSRVGARAICLMAEESVAKEAAQRGITRAQVSCERALALPGPKLLVCGNGGSSADSAHIVGELVKGFLKKRPVDEAMVRATGCDRL